MEITFFVKGAYFRGPDAKEISDNLKVGDTVLIQPEPENQHDAYACAVFYEDIHIGYVEKDVAHILSVELSDRQMDQIAGKVLGHLEGERVSYPQVTVDFVP